MLHIAVVVLDFACAAQLSFLCQGEKLLLENYSFKCCDKKQER